MSTQSAPSRAFIDLGAYVHNISVIRKLVGPRVHIMAVVKANAYGHGLIPIAKAACAAGIDMLGVATVEEGAELRQAGITHPILVLFQPEPSALPPILEYNLAVMIADTDTAVKLGELARAANRVVSVHCQIDSGMGRQGFSLEKAPEDLQFLTRISHVDIQGVATHFPAADQPEDAFTLEQIRIFKNLLKQLSRQGTPYEVAHAANSAAIVNYPQSYFDMVRPGLMTYGVWPTKNRPTHCPLRPVLRWETTVTQVRSLPAGASISYGRTFTAPAPMNVAILPVGYADGFSHHLSNRGYVLIRGTRCAVLGAVCMDQTVVDVTHLPGLQPGEPVTLIGADDSEHITPETLAELAETIPYEILTGIGARVRRIYLEPGGKPVEAAAS